VQTLEVPLKDLLGALDTVKGTRLVDPSVAPTYHGSLPFRHIESLQEFCSQLLRHYITLKTVGDKQEIELRENPTAIETLHCNFLRTGSDKPSLSEPAGKTTNCTMRLYRVAEGQYKLCITPRLELATLQYLQSMFDDEKNFQRMKSLGEVSTPPLNVLIKSKDVPKIDEVRPYLTQLEAYLLSLYTPFLQKITGVETKNIESFEAGDSNWLAALVLCEKVLHCEYESAGKRMFVYYKQDASVGAGLAYSDKKCGRIAAIYFDDEADPASEPIKVCLAPPTFDFGELYDAFGQPRQKPYLQRQLAQLFMQSVTLIFENQAASENDSMTSQSVSMSDSDSDAGSSGSGSLNSGSGDGEEAKEDRPAARRERCALI
jgi:hypothetical protein